LVAVVAAVVVDKPLVITTHLRVMVRMAAAAAVVVVFHLRQTLLEAQAEP
jgi:hypothetical protein